MKKFNLKYSYSDTIVCWLKQKNDLSILLNEGWYRIPVKTKLDKLFEVKYLAFYQSHAFGKNSYIIKHYGIIDKIEKVKRNELFPNETLNSKTHDEYRKVTMKDMKILDPPIKRIRKRNRNNTFINTTYEKLLSATEINDLFNESWLEDVLWIGMKENKIVAERQYIVQGNKKKYFLDFAAICNKGRLDIECDGAQYHEGEENEISDSQRDSYLIKDGWSILRYKTAHVKNTEKCIDEIKESIAQKGGLAV